MLGDLVRGDAALGHGIDLPGVRPAADAVRLRAAVGIGEKGARQRLHAVAFLLRMGFGRTAVSENRGPDSLRGSGIKWMSGGAEPQCS